MFVKLICISFLIFGSMVILTLPDGVDTSMHLPLHCVANLVF